MDPIRAGALISFDALHQKTLSEQWGSEKIEPCLRMVLITTAMLFHEQRASRLLIRKILGNTQAEIENKNSPHHYGCAADVGIHELIDARILDKRIYMERRFAKAEWITQRVNELFPFGDGRKVAAIYNVDHLHLECPLGGFKKTTCALSTWSESGATGIIRPPRLERKVS